MMLYKKKLLLAIFLVEVSANNLVVFKWVLTLDVALRFSQYGCLKYTFGFDVPAYWGSNLAHSS